MTNPNEIVASDGETVTLERVTNAVYDEFDEFDIAASTVEQVQIKAIASSPSERDIRRAEGMMESPSLKLTVESSTDISATREGRRDRIIRDGTTFEVGEVRRDRHPFVGIEKTTVMLEPLPGR